MMTSVRVDNVERLLQLQQDALTTLQTVARAEYNSMMRRNVLKLERVAMAMRTTLQALDSSQVIGRTDDRDNVSHP